VQKPREGLFCFWVKSAVTKLTGGRREADWRGGLKPTNNLLYTFQRSLNAGEIFALKALG